MRLCPLPRLLIPVSQSLILLILLPNRLWNCSLCLRSHTVILVQIKSGLKAGQQGSPVIRGDMTRNMRQWVGRHSGLRAEPSISTPSPPSRAALYCCTECALCYTQSAEPAHHMCQACPKGMRSSDGPRPPRKEGKACSVAGLFC